MILTPEQQRKVLDSAMQEFATTSMRDISLETLSRASSVPAFDIVRHYHSRENILTAVLERELELMASAVHAPALRFPGETLKDELHVLAGVILQEYRSRLPFLRRTLAESMSDAEFGALFYRTFIVQGRLLFAEFLKERAELGELREELDVEAAAAIFLAALTGSLWMIEVFGGRKVEALDDDRLIGEISELFVNGVKR